MADLQTLYTPSELFDKKEATESTKKSKLIGKGFILASCIIILLMGLFFLISLLYSEDGSFTIRVGDATDINQGAISLSETPGFANPTVKLSGIPIDGMDNTTYKWLPLDELDTGAGSHNGEKYIAYTFYIKNSSDKAVDYETTMLIESATRGVDKAVRIMVYKDGVPTIYAHATENGLTERYPENIVNFLSDSVAFSEVYENVLPGEMHKFTVVIWLEGEDPDCVDDVLKGVMKMSLRFEEISHEQ